jgi:hypothetical protein
MLLLVQRVVLQCTYMCVHVVLMFTYASSDLAVTAFASTLIE